MADRVCPVDSTELRRLERSGVQVDACPTCRGLWLDRGELDKILEQESQSMEEFEREISGGSERRERDDDRPRQSDGHGGGHGGSSGKKKKRSSVLGEFLDFG